MSEWRVEQENKKAPVLPGLFKFRDLLDAAFIENLVFRVFADSLQFGLKAVVGDIDAFGGEVGLDLGHDVLETGFFDVGADDIARITKGGIAGKSLFFSGPEPEKLGAARIYFKIQLLVMCKFVFKGILAVVQFGHFCLSSVGFYIQKCKVHDL